MRRLVGWPLGAAATTNNVVFTATFNGHLYAFNANTGTILLSTALSASTNSQVTIDGDYVIVGAGAPLSKSQQPLLIAYKLGANGKLPDTVTP
jgi:outer membrane protein assembly factor BamB